MKTKQIIIRFLDSFPGTLIGSHNVQIDIPNFARQVYGKSINPETMSREWRKLRDDKKFLEDNGYSIIESMESKGREKKFIIRRTSEVHRNSNGNSEESGKDYTPDRPEEVSEGGNGTV